MTADAAPSPTQPVPPPGALRSFLELFAAAGLAIGQPTLSTLGTNPLEFISRRVLGLEIVIVGLLVIVVPPLVLWGVELLVGLASTGLRVTVHRLLVSGLLGLVVLEIVPVGPTVGWLGIAAGIGTAIGVWFLLGRSGGLTDWLRYLAVAPIVFLVVFLQTPGIRSLALSSPPDAVALDGVDEPVPVVLIVFDELPTLSLLDSAGDLDAELFPNFARLADQSTWYIDNATVASWTSVAIPAIEVGRYPTRRTNVAHWSRYEESVFTLLGNEYDMYAQEVTTQVCPPGMCEGQRDDGTGGLTGMLRILPGMWADGASPFEEPEVDFIVAGDQSQTVPDAAASAVEGISRAEDGQEDPSPQFTYIHLDIPHYPWTLVASGEGYDAPKPVRGLAGEDWEDQYSADAGRNRHLLYLQLTDRYLGDLLDQLDAAGTFDDSLVIVTSDHGGSFDASTARRALDDGNEYQITRTPLFVKRPGQEEGEIDLRPTQTIDIVPTIADTIGVDLPWDVDGERLDSAPAREERRYYPVGTDRRLPGPAGYVVLDDAPLTEQVDLLPELSGRDRVFNIGTDLPVIGDDVTDFAVGPAGPAVEVGRPELVGDRVGGDVAAVYVYGTLAEAPQGAVAVALNGRIGLVTTGREYDGRFEFFGVVDPTLVEDDGNRLEFFEIDEDGTTLRPLPLAAA